MLFTNVFFKEVFLFGKEFQGKTRTKGIKKFCKKKVETSAQELCKDFQEE